MKNKRDHAKTKNKDFLNLFCRDLGLRNNQK